MGTVLIVVILLLVLTATFNSVADWFEETKNIDILPVALIDVVAVIVFIFACVDKPSGANIWMGLSGAVVLGTVVYNMVQHGYKDGALASLAELVFSISAAFLIIFLLSGTNSKKDKKKKR